MKSFPVIFVSHGAPTLVIEEGATQSFLQELGAELGRPEAILCISAHWETDVPAVTGAARPETIYDFYGFPQKLYEIKYGAPGSPSVAQRIATLLQEQGFQARVDPARGLDHGVWVPLALMYPAADVPVLQLSIQSRRGPEHHWKLGQALQSLRDEGVLIIGSGSITHNLREFHGQSIDTPPSEYVREFDVWLEDAITHGRKDALLNCFSEAPYAQRAHPTPDHIMPLFVALGAAGEQAQGRRIHHAYNYGMLSMAAYRWD